MNLLVKKAIIKSTLGLGVIIMLAASPTFVNAGKISELALPRSLGPLALGMTVEDFKKITGLTAQVCAHCANDEDRVGFDVSKYPDQFPKYLYSLSRGDRWIECGFYKNRLYKMTFAPEDKTISEAQARYIRLYGPATRTVEWADGDDSLVWESSSTSFGVTYIRQKKKVNFFADLFTPSVGSVLSLEYADRKLRESLEAAEKLDSRKHPH